MVALSTHYYEEKRIARHLSGYIDNPLLNYFYKAYSNSNTTESLTLCNVAHREKLFLETDLSD